MAHQEKTPTQWWVSFLAVPFITPNPSKSKTWIGFALRSRSPLADLGAKLGSKVPDGPPKILGSKVPENFYLLPLHSSLFTKNAPENFEVIGNSEELKSENYIGSDSSQVSPPKILGSKVPENFYLLC